MKKILFLSLMLLGGLSFSEAGIVPLTVGYDDPYGTMPSLPKTPTQIPVIDLEEGVVTFKASHAPYTLCIVDEDNLVVYSVSVPTTVTIVTLPVWLNGDYELRLLTGENYYFYGTIEL